MISIDCLYHSRTSPNYHNPSYSIFPTNAIFQTLKTMNANEESALSVVLSTKHLVAFPYLILSTTHIN